MNKVKKFIIGATTVLSTIGCAGAIFAANTAKTYSASAAAADKVAEYYKGISDSATGTTLLNDLHSLNVSKRKSTPGYKGHRNYYHLTEVDPNGTTPKGKMYGFYDNALISDSWDNQATWNHEHVWPNSLGGGKVDGDIHMPRPTSVKINSSRGNLCYAASGAYDPGQYIANYRGIAARIIFYSAIADTSLSVVDKIGLKSGANAMGKLSDLLKWNLEYLPDTSSSAALELRIEQNRNNVIESQVQGNRNPFIDHPEYACRIWGNTNATTQEICKKNVTPKPDNDDDGDDDGENTKNGCNGSIVAASSIVCLTSLGGFLLTLKKRKEEDEE